jgi:LuxR family quorum sensing-dependent transcriptional regulator
VAFDALARHPLVAEARSTDMPFGLADVFRRSAMSQDEWQRDLPPSLAARDGLVIPVHDEGRLAWFVCFAGEQAPADRHAMCVLAAASYAARARANALSKPRPRDKHVLTPREMECLRQAASGMTDSEIGRCLGISGRTVRFHIGNAKVKLGARSRLHAVTRAMDA